MIRKYQPTDSEIVQEMMNEFYHSPAVLKPVDEGNFSSTLEQVENNSPYVSVYVICDGEEVVGYGLLSHSYSNEAGGFVVWVEEIYIREEHRGKKLGKEFFDYIMEAFWDCAIIRLEVKANNKKAIKFYESLGFNRLDYVQYVFKTPKTYCPIK